jgi:hypothetical protein
MTDKKKPHTAGAGTASKTTFDSRHSTGNDPLLGWFNLAKPSRDRQQKHSWERNNRGRIDPTIAADIVLLAIAALLILGVIHA